jgi:hypothetical protein
MSKEWVDVYGYEDIYEVNIEGKVRNKKTGNIMAEYSSGHMYNYVQLNKDAKTVKHYVHRLIAMHFIPNPGGYKQVNHKDLDKRNNSIDNLEWVTPAQNVRHAVDNGAFDELREISKETIKRVRKYRKKVRKLNKEDVAKARLLFEQGVSKIYIAKMLKTSPAVVSNILEGRTYKDY